MVFKKLFNRNSKEPEKQTGKTGEFGKDPEKFVSQPGGFNKEASKFGGDPGQKNIDEINAEKATYLKTHPQSAPAPMGAKKYVTNANDTLSSLALKFYGDGSAKAWKKILDANPEMFKGDAGNIKAGMELYIPMD